MTNPAAQNDSLFHRFLRKFRKFIRALADFDPLQSYGYGYRVPMRLSEIEFPPAVTESTVTSHESAVVLYKLPNELIIEIMSHLTADSLWSLRQCSRIFIKLFERQNFRHFHGEPRVIDPLVPFLIASMTDAEKSNVATHIRHDLSLSPEAPEMPGISPDTECTKCDDILRRGEEDERMAKLHKTHYCQGCKERHSALFFSDDTMDKYERGIGELVCIGRLGSMTLCSHLGSLTWDALRPPSTDISRHTECDKPSHIPRPITAFDKSPWINIYRRHTLPGFNLTMGWTFTFLEIDEENASLSLIRHTTANLVTEKFMGAESDIKPCKHMTGLGTRKLRAFAYSGICACFAKRNFDSDLCRCNRQKKLKCEDCGAKYTWRLSSNRWIKLSYEYGWILSGPCSPAWLNLLDDIPNGHGVFNEKNRHVTWCDQPSCKTGLGPRWEELVKRGAWLHHIKFGDTSHQSLDFKELKGKKGLKMPRDGQGNISVP